MQHIAQSPCAELSKLQSVRVKLTAQTRPTRDRVERLTQDVRRCFAVGAINDHIATCPACQARKMQVAA